ncbi:MAG: LL-diaminopimelate aminotransferase [Armatimonadota bacterium]
MPAPSKRLDAIPPYLFAEISRIKAEKIASGADMIDLGIGDPDQPTPLGIIRALQRAAEDPRTHSYDESPRGWKPFLQAAAKWYEREYGVALDPAANMLEVIGSKEGLAHIVWAFCDPGDVVLVPDPGYPVYRVHAKMAGATVHPMPLLEQNGFLPNLADIPTDAARRAKMMFVCYPCNPTGAVATHEFFEEAVRFCREYDILLVSDMAYAQVTYDGYKPPAALQMEGSREHVIEFHSLSKPFNMTGWRIGFACGAPSAVETLGRFKDNVDTKQFPAVAEAAAFALLEGDNSATMELYKKRRDALVGGLTQAGWRVEPPRATFYVWARVPTGESSADFAKRLLEEASVLVIPGTGYGETGEGYVRMSLTVRGDVAGERLAEAAQRIAGVALGRV